LYLAKKAIGGDHAGSEMALSQIRKHMLLPAVKHAAADKNLAAMAASTANSTHELARTRRELDCRHREESSDKQVVLNEVLYMLQRRTGSGVGPVGGVSMPVVGPVQVSKDLDLVLPHLRTVLLVRERPVTDPGEVPDSAPLLHVMMSRHCMRQCVFGVFLSSVRLDCACEPAQL
jgi:hypothetical protein